MNQDQLISLLSTLLKIIGTSVVAHGTLGINGAAWEQISGAAIMLAPVLFDMYRHTDAKKIISAATMPGVKVIVDPQVATQAVAAVAADPGQPKVTAVAA